MNQREVFQQAHGLAKVRTEGSYREAFKFALSYVQTVNAAAIRADKLRIKDDDCLFTAIAKLGGISRQEASLQGIDSGLFSVMTADMQPVIGYRVFSGSGDSFDGMAERLAGYGYFSGSYGANELLDLVQRHLYGETVYTAVGYELVMKAEHEFFGYDIAA